MKIIKVKDSSEIPENFTGIVEYPNEDKLWYKEGNLHREDGPAIEWADGDKWWCKNGFLHRENGPAVERSNGTKEWWLEGKFYYLKNIRDYVVLDSYQGKYGIMWYKLLKKDKIVDYPDIPGLITK